MSKAKNAYEKLNTAQRIEFLRWIYFETVLGKGIGGMHDNDTGEVRIIIPDPKRRRPHPAGGREG